MADFGTPVAQNVDVSPKKSLETISSLMGLTQQRQAIAGQAAEVQQLQQTTRQRAAMAQVDWSRHIGPDGVLNTASFAQDPQIRQAAGDQYPAILEHANQIRQGQIQSKQQLFTLTKEQNDALRQQLGGLAGDPDVQADNPAGRAKVKSSLTQFGQDYGPAAAKLSQNYIPMVDNVPQGKLGTALNTAGLQAADVSHQITATTGTATSINDQRNIQPGMAGGPMSAHPGAFTPSGSPVKVQLGPTDQPGYIRSRAAAGAEGTAGATNDEQLYNTIVQKGTQATQIKSLSQDVQNLAHEVQTGQYSKAFADKWAAAAQLIGVKPQNLTETTRRQILSKMAAQLKVQSEGSASTDTERAGISAALPDPETMGPEAVSQAARYVGAQADVTASRAQLANQHRLMHGNTSTGLRDVDSRFMQNADPRVFEYQQLSPGKERQDYLRQHFTSKEALLEFKSKADRLKQYGAIQ